MTGLAKVFRGLDFGPERLAQPAQGHALGTGTQGMALG